MTKPQRDETKRVNFLTPAVFNTSPSPRLTTHAAHCNLLFLDIDDSDEARSLIPHLAKRVAPFAYACYTTARHTEALPRVRVVVDADRIPVERYAQAVETLAARLGVTANRESKVPVQPMFLPSLFSDQDPDNEHPLIAEDRNGEPFRERDITEQQASTSKPKASTRSGGDDLDDLEFLRPPLPEITLDIAAEALNTLDPDCGYATWVDTGFALKHQFSRAEEDERAFALWDEWSSKGSKYGGTEATRKKWTELAPHPKGRLPITIRHLLHTAVTEGGWQSAVAKDRCFQATRASILAAPSFSALTSDGVLRIAGTPLLSSAEEDALLNLIASQARARFETKINLPSLRKDLQRTQAKIKRAAAPPADEKKTPPWARGVCFVSSAGVFVRHTTGERFTPENFDRVYGRRLLPSEDAIDDPSPKALCTPVVKPSDYVLNDIKCPLAYDFDYDPTHPNEVFFVRDSRTYLNTYTRTYPAPREDLFGIASDPLLRHLDNLIAEPEYRRVVLDWMAYHVQHPGRKIRWAVLLQGTEGCGKSWLAEVMRAVLGQQHVKTVDCAALRQTWNEWAVGHQLVVLEEIRVRGHERHEVMNVLKPLITNPYISVNRRNTDNRECPNRTNYLLFTNHHDAIVITPGDRRYFVLESPLQTKEQVAALKTNDPDYFVRLFDLVTNHGPELRHFFEEWQISPEFNPDSDAPETVYRTRLIDSGLNDTQAAVRDAIATSETPLVQPDLLSREALLNILRTEPGVRPPTSQYLRSVLIDDGWVEVRRTKLDGSNHTIFTKGHAADPIEEIKRRLNNSEITI